MLSFILPLFLKSKNFALYFVALLLVLGIGYFAFSYSKIKSEKENCKKEIDNYKKIEEEVKIFHEEKINLLKETLKIRQNAKKIDYNDSGNLDDDFLLKSLE